LSAFLRSMAELSRRRVDAAARIRPFSDLEREVMSLSPVRSLGSFGEQFDLIAEIKPRSPSEGSFPVRDPVATAHGYVAGGAAVLSVLTEPSEFGGSLLDLERVSGAVDIPVMAKDFLVDRYQVCQARLAGADGVLVVVRILDDPTMVSLLDAAGGLGMFTLLEAFDLEDIRRITGIAAGVPNVLIGVNCRDLDSLSIVPNRHEELAGELPQGMVAVAESSIGGAADAERVARLGYRAALVGSALMRDDDAPALVGSLLSAARRIGVPT